MAAEYFVARDDIQKLTWELIAKNHPDLAGNLNKDELIVLFREQGQKSGGKVVLGKAQKVPPLANALANENYKFVLELAQDKWDELDTKQREALLDHLLCSCHASTNEKTGEAKFQIAKPDVAVFRENIERYGMWFPRDDEDDSGGADTVGELLGGDAGESAEDLLGDDVLSDE